MIFFFLVLRLHLFKRSDGFQEISNENVYFTLAKRTIFSVQCLNFINVTLLLEIFMRMHSKVEWQLASDKDRSTIHIWHLDLNSEFRYSKSGEPNKKRCSYSLPTAIGRLTHISTFEV